MRNCERIVLKKGILVSTSQVELLQRSPTARRAYLLAVAGTAVSFLVPEGDGREPLGFFGSTVPLLTVVRKGRVCTSGLAARRAERGVRTRTSVQVAL